MVTKPGFPTIDHIPDEVPIEKKRQGNSPNKRKAGKFSIPLFKRTENTSVRIIIIAKGLNKAHKKPRTEFRYLILKSLLTRFLTSSP